MADRPQVVKLAQPGIDVKTAGDENLVYNSNWPLLKIYKQGSATISDFNNTTTLATHDLGYVPAFWYFVNDSINDYFSTVATPDARSEFTGPITFFPSITDSKLVYNVNPATESGTAKIYYYIFALDITKKYEAPIIRSGGVIGPRNTNTVFKLAKPGKDISSPNLVDYVVNTDARSPLIHAIIPAVTSPDNSPGGNGFTYYHNLGYIPMFFAYAKQSSNFGVNNFTPNSYLIYTVNNSSSGFTVDEQKISFTYSFPGQVITLLILKDPFIVGYSIPVTV